MLSPRRRNADNLGSLLECLFATAQNANMVFGVRGNTRLLVNRIEYRSLNQKLAGRQSGRGFSAQLVFRQTQQPATYEFLKHSHLAITVK